MSFSLKSFVGEANVKQTGITGSGSEALGKSSWSLKGDLNASLPEGLSAKLTITDGSLRSVRARGAGAARAHNRARLPRARPLRRLGADPGLCFSHV
jgi:hypothetical protein